MSTPRRRSQYRVAWRLRHASSYDCRASWVMYDQFVKREDLSPNDPRAVIEDPRIVREEAQLRVFGRIFMFGLQIAAVAMAIVLVIPSRTDPASFLQTLRTFAIHTTWIALLIAFSGPILKLIHHLRSRR